MIIDRKHVGWGIGTVVASLAIAIVYLANNDPAALEKHGIRLALRRGWGLRRRSWRMSARRHWG